VDYTDNYRKREEFLRSYIFSIITTKRCERDVTKISPSIQRGAEVSSIPMEKRKKIHPASPNKHSSSFFIFYLSSWSIIPPSTTIKQINSLLSKKTRMVPSSK